MAPRLTCSTTNETFDKVVKMADEERRSISSMTAILLERGIEASATRSADADFIALVAGAVDFDPALKPQIEAFIKNTKRPKRRAA